jgi:hypothetical protein
MNPIHIFQEVSESLKDSADKSTNSATEKLNKYFDLLLDPFPIVPKPPLDADRLII